MKLPDRLLYFMCIQILNKIQHYLTSKLKMNLNEERKNIQQLYYGLKAKIFEHSKLFEATIYIDNLYDNFLWIATNQKSFIVDLSYASISYYSLEFQLEIKNHSKYQQQTNKKYILLKELNTEVPIIFIQQHKKTQVSSQQNFTEFAKGRKPLIFDAFEGFINKKKGLCKYSANFSRYFKKLRLSLESVQPQSFTEFTPAQVIGAFNLMDEFKPMAKEGLFGQGKKISVGQVFEALKFLYCRLNSTLLKSLSITSTKNISGIKSQKYEQEGSREEDFKKLMQLEDPDRNYIVVNYKINENFPLTDYFCFSSHNTYLTGNQITSDCKISRYIEDLKKGIKCVELDVHNMGGNEPIITHAVKGKGFCKPITFRATIEAMDQFLEYNKDHYPIVLSIQNHASRENQDLMNNILRKQFPKNILIPNDKKQFYKLSEIKGKIIIKTSCSMESLNQFKNNDQTPKIKSYDLGAFNSTFSQSSSQSTIPIKSNLLSAEGQFIGKQMNEDQSQYKQNGEYQVFLQKIKKYKNLKAKFNERIDQNSYLPVQKIVQITCMFKAPKGIETLSPSPFECSSMQNAKIAKTAVQKIVTYTKKAFLRSYPEGTQIYSNNYNFLELLIRGVQIIALNTQTNDDYAIMMNSYFRAGRPRNMAEIGYIEKPQYLRASNGQMNSKYPSERRNYEFAFYTNHQLEFKVYSLDQVELTEKTIMDNVKRVEFSLRHFNESFLVIKVAKKKWIQCLPLRFLHYENQKVFKNIIARDYEFEDTGIRIPCSFKWTRQ